MTAYCKRAFHRRSGKDLLADEIFSALRFWVARTQEVAFVDEIAKIKDSIQCNKGKLVSLNQFIDEMGLLRVGGRLQNSDRTFDEKHPCVLPKTRQVNSVDNC